MGSTLMYIHMPCSTLGEFKRDGGVCPAWGKLRGFLLLVRERKLPAHIYPPQGLQQLGSCLLEGSFPGMGFYSPSINTDKQGTIKKLLKGNGNPTWRWEEKV